MLEPSSPAPRRRWMGALRGRLVLLVLAILAPALAATLLLLVNAYRHERVVLADQISEQASALRLGADRQLGQNRVLLHALSASKYLARSEFSAFDDFARRAVLDDETWVVVTRGDDTQVVNTLFPVGAAPKLHSFVGDSGQGVWSSVQPDGAQISDVFFSPASQAAVIAVSREITLNDGGRVRLSVATRAKSFGRLWRDQGFPSSWTGVVMDSRDRVITRSRGGDSFIGRSASSGMKARIADAPSGVAETTTLDGVRSITAWVKEPGYGWIFLVAVPRDEVAGAAQRSLVVAALGGAGLLVLGLGLAAWMARSIARPVESLTAATRAWSQGKEPEPIPAGVSEIEELGAAFAETAQRLARQQAELRDLNTTLEARVADRTRELKETAESLVQAQKLEAIGRLTGGVAHDFNNLLMAISGNLDLLKRRLVDQRQLHYVSQAKQATERGAKLTGQLLAFSRKQRLQPRPVDVNAAIGEARELLVSTLGGAVRVETALHPALWPALADATQLELVILNLAINARDAMPGGGLMTISTANVTRARPSERPEGPPAGEFVRIAIADTGTGIPAEVLDRVFEPFFTTKEVGQGSGLGLPQVLGLAKQLGGGVELASAAGVGTTVEVFLPRADGQVTAEVAPQDGLVQSFHGARVLLVDDDNDVRSVASAMLCEMGCVVTPTASGQAALEAVLAGKGFDLVLLDFAMPGINGAKTAARIRALRPDLAMVMMSGFADAEILANEWTGALLHKPFSAASLAAEIATALSMGAPQ